MQPDSIDHRGQNGVGFLEQEYRMVLGLWSKRYRKGYRYAARHEAREDREDRMVLVLWNKRYRKEYRYAAR